MKLKTTQSWLMLTHPWDGLLGSSGVAHASLGRDRKGNALMMIEGRAFTPRDLKGIRWRIVRATPAELETLRQSPYLRSFTGCGLRHPRQTPAPGP